MSGGEKQKLSLARAILHDRPNYFFWTSQNRTHQIEKANPAEHDFDIPVISLTIPELEDSLELLFQLKNLFAKERYNAYVASSEKSCVLYDIEFLPVLENRRYCENQIFLILGNLL